MLCTAVRGLRALQATTSVLDHGGREVLVRPARKSLLEVRERKLGEAGGNNEFSPERKKNATGLAALQIAFPMKKIATLPLFT